MIITPELFPQLLMNEVASARKGVMELGTLDQAVYLSFYGVTRLEGKLYRQFLGGNPDDPEQVADAARIAGQRKLVMVAIFAATQVQIEVARSPDGSANLGHSERLCILVSGGTLNIDEGIGGYNNALFPVNLEAGRYRPGLIRAMMTDMTFVHSGYNPVVTFIESYVDYAVTHNLFPAPRFS